MKYGEHVLKCYENLNAKNVCIYKKSNLFIFSALENSQY